MRKKPVKKIGIRLLVTDKVTGKQKEIKAEQYPNCTVKVFMFIVPNRELKYWLDVAGYRFIKLLD